MTHELKIRAFGSAEQLRLIEAYLREEFARWQDIWQAPHLDLQLFRAPPELLDHTLVMANLFRETIGRAVEAAGCNVSSHEAVAACVGEVVEHDIGRHWKPDEFKKVSARDLESSGEIVFPVRKYIGKPRRTDRWPFRTYTEDLELTWVRGDELHSGMKVWIPASFSGFSIGDPAEALTEVTTSGLAAEFDLERATRHAVLELLERDAVMCRWILAEPFRRVPAGALQGLTQALDKDKRIGWETSIFETRSEFGPQICFALSRHSGKSYYSLGASADPDPEKRLAHALAEAVQVRFLLVVKGAPEVEHISNFQDHLFHYCNPQRLDRLNILTGSSPGRLRRNTCDLPEIVGNLHRGGIAPIRVPLAESQTHNAGAVARVLAPGLQHMEANERCARVSPGRFLREPEEYWPHPFP